MLRSKDVPLLRQGNMRIYFRDIDRTVPQHFLDITDINIRLQEAGGKCVPEHMGSDMEGNGGQGGIFVDHPPDSLVG